MRNNHHLEVIFIPRERKLAAGGDGGKCNSKKTVNSFADYIYIYNELCNHRFS